MIAKLEAYSIRIHKLTLVFSYLKNWNQSVHFNSTNSDFKNISGVPKGSLLGPTFFNLPINDLFYFIISALVCSFADDNTFLVFAKSVLELISILDGEFVNTVHWFDANKVLVNPVKCKVLIRSLQFNLFYRRNQIN